VPARNGEPLAQVPLHLRVLRMGLVALLAVCAALTLFAVPALRGRIASGQWPEGALAAPPVILAVFLVGFAVYRIALVQLGRYPAGKALQQIALLSLAAAVMAGLILFPEEDGTAGRPVSLVRALRSQDGTVRALAAELAGHRPAEEARAYLPELVHLLDDDSPEVRRQAHRSLVTIAGGDLGGEGPGAAERWRARLGAPPAP